MTRAHRDDQLTIVLKDPLLSRIREYHQHAGLPGSAQDVIRDLLETALDQPFLFSKLLKLTRLRAWKQTAWTVLGELRDGFDISTKTFTEKLLSTFEEEDGTIDQENP